MAETQAPAKNEAVVYVLEKNFGYIEGREHKFIEAGTELSESEDAAMLAKLHQLGANLALKK